MTDETYLENGLECYSSDGRRVWPRRFRQQPDMKTGEPKGPLRDDRFVTTVLKQLDELEATTRPSVQGSERGKDMKAFQALLLAAWLFDHVAGWAIDHQIGLAANGLKFVPSLPTQTKKLPEYVEAREAVDVHEHERIGGRIDLAKMGAEELRHVSINILEPLIARIRIPPALVESLKALDTGETLPLLEAAPTNDKVRYREMHFQLQAVAFVEYQIARGKTKLKAQESVGAAFGVSPHTLRGWESGLREKMGNLEVSAAINRARNQAHAYEEDEKRRFSGSAYQDEDLMSPLMDLERGPYSHHAVGRKYQEFLGFRPA